MKSRDGTAKWVPLSEQGEKYLEPVLVPGLSKTKETLDLIGIVNSGRQSSDF